MNEFSILIGGKAGDGIDKAGAIIARIFNRLGFRLYLIRVIEKQAVLCQSVPVQIQSFLERNAKEGDSPVGECMVDCGECLSTASRI